MNAYPVPPMSRPYGGEAFGYPETWDVTELPAAAQARPVRCLPFDFTAGSGSIENPRCDAELWLTDAYGREVGRYCTRRPGHSGRHAAGTGEIIIAVW